MSASIVRSSVDEARFGVRTAKVSVDSTERLRSALAACRDQQVRLIILRIPTQATTTVFECERAGALLMDTLCFYEIFPAVHALAPVSGVQQHISFRPGTPDDASLVESMARDAFRGYGSHYSNDPRLRPDDTAEVYPSWARACCEQARADQPVVIASHAGEAVGFAAMRSSRPAELDVALLGVCTSSRGMGVASALLRRLIDSSAGWNVSRLTYSTQITNVAMQRLLATAGFLPTESFYTFHLWCDEVR